MVKEMCKEAEFNDNYSLRAYGATKMFQAKVPEKLIQQRTGRIVFKGCTFTGHAISMSGQASNENTYEYGMQDFFKGIDIDDVFNDWFYACSVNYFWLNINL